MSRAIAMRLAAFILAAGILPSAAAPAGEKPSPAMKARIDRGKYLVTLGGCEHCHSPKVMTPNGPVPHPTRALSGHPAEMKTPAVPSGVLAPDKWMALTNADMTVWVGPWGTSYSANLTPDPATGIGGWTEEMFLSTIRKGKHLGTGRAILPPMPWMDIAKLTDDDLKSIFAYLKSVPPIANAVPQPTPPMAGGH